MSVELPVKRSRRRTGRPKARVAGRIISLASMDEYEGSCWICGKRVTLWGWGMKWAGRWWCGQHHPLRPSFRTRKNSAKRIDERTLHPLRRYNTFTGVHNNSPDASDRDIARHERKVDAALGRKKRKPAKQRKRSRDRAYVR